MKDSITARVFRFNPDEDGKPYYDTFEVKADEEMSVLSLLNRIQEEQDPTLSFRSFCCGLQMCRACLMKIDRKKKYACITLVAPGAQVTIEPYNYPEAHVKDLVVESVE
jgi:succinate dehydrogenase/fumarate reductase-like Fe-S protein